MLTFGFCMLSRYLDRRNSPGRERSTVLSSLSPVDIKFGALTWSGALLSR